MNTNYKKCRDRSKLLNPLWDAYWRRRFSGVEIDRDIVEKLDRDGTDVILKLKNGKRYHVDEKYSIDRYGLEKHPIEVLKNVELKKYGWAVTNFGNWVAMVHIPESESRNEFLDEPVFFEINDKFQQRIVKSKAYKEYMTQTDGLYHTKFKVVPKEDLQNANNDAYWASDKPLWAFYQ